MKNKIENGNAVVYIFRGVTNKEAVEALEWLKRMADRWTMHQNDYYNEQTERAYQIVKDYIKQKEKLQND